MTQGSYRVCKSYIGNANESVAGRRQSLIYTDVTASLFICFFWCQRYTQFRYQLTVLCLNVLLLPVPSFRRCNTTAVWPRAGRTKAFTRYSTPSFVAFFKSYSTLSVNRSDMPYYLLAAKLFFRPQLLLHCEHTLTGNTH